MTPFRTSSKDLNRHFGEPQMKDGSQAEIPIEDSY